MTLITQGVSNDDIELHKALNYINQNFALKSSLLEHSNTQNEQLTDRLGHPDDLEPGGKVEGEGCVVLSSVSTADNNCSHLQESIKLS